MNIVIDFNGFLTQKNHFIIKEYSLYTINNRGKIRFHSFGVDKSVQKKLGAKIKENYDNYYKKYGIKWTTGTLGRRKMKITLNKYFTESMNIFVADNDRKNKLINYLNYDPDKNKNVSKIVCLSELGYKLNFKNSTNCHYHESPSSNNCANDNVLKMIEFVRDKKLYNTNMRANTYSIIDFNCYKYSNHLRFKEVSINRISIDGIATSRDLFVEKALKLQSEPVTYKEYYRKYGIKWKNGNEVPRLIRENLYYTLKRSIRTYVKDNTQKKILLGLSNGDIGNKIICLDELGYDVGNTELGFTVCEWHDNKMANNCADDNVRFMTDWLHRKKLLKLEISGNLKVNKVERNFKTPSVVVHKGSVYQDIKDIKARYYQAHGSREFPSVGNAAAVSTSVVGKRKFDNLEMAPTVAQHYDAFASELSSTNQAKKRQRIDENDDDVDVFDIASELGIKIKDSDDDVFDMASKSGIEIKDDNARMINETVAPNMSRYYQSHGSNDFRINQTEEQINYDDENAINIALELESQAGKYVPQDLADLNPELLYKYQIDDLHDSSFRSSEFDDLLEDDEINNSDIYHSKLEVDQRNDGAGEKLLSSSIFNNSTNLFDDDDDELNDFINIGGLVHSEVMSDNRRENNDLENEIFDEKFLDTYIVNNSNDISFDEDEFNDILDKDEL